MCVFHLLRAFPPVSFIIQNKHSRAPCASWSVKSFLSSKPVCESPPTCHHVTWARQQSVPTRRGVQGLIRNIIFSPIQVHNILTSQLFFLWQITNRDHEKRVTCREKFENEPDSIYVSVTIHSHTVVSWWDNIYKRYKIWLLYIFFLWCYL